MKKLLALSLATAGLFALSPNRASAQPTKVDLELALLVDVSGSVSSSEFLLQRNAYAAFFSSSNAVFWNAFQAANASLAVSYVYWSDSYQQQQLGGTGKWYGIFSAQDAYNFGSIIASTSQPYQSMTAPGDAIHFITPQFDNNLFIGTRRVIDVSGDGCQNAGMSTSGARNSAEDKHITINGITIGDDDSDCGRNTPLAQWYNNNVRTSDGFVLSAADFDTFSEALGRKITYEVVGGGCDPTKEQCSFPTPEPSSALLLVAGAAGMFFLARRRRLS